MTASRSVAKARPSRCGKRGPAPRRTAMQAVAAGSAAPERWSRPRSAIRAAASAGWRRAARSSRHPPPAVRSRARCSSPAQSASPANGDTRGLAPPVSVASLAVSAVRSSPSVPSAGMLASSSPSGCSACRSWISAPGRSVTQCKARLATTRSNRRRAERQCLQPRRPPPGDPAAPCGGESSSETVSMPRARSRGATTPRPPTSRAWVKRRVVSSSRSSRRSAIAPSTGVTWPIVAAARSRCRRSAWWSKIGSMRRMCRPWRALPRAVMGAAWRWRAFWAGSATPCSACCCRRAA